MTMSRRSRRTHLSALVLGFALCFAGLALARAGDQALIIGIADYDGEENDLRFTGNDAVRIADLAIRNLGFPPEGVHLVRDKEATRDNIIRIFRQELIGKTGPGDRVLFFFSGHGSQVPDFDGDEDDGLDEVLVTVDWTSEPRYVGDDDLASLLDQLEGRDVLVLVDSCHSGTITRSALSEEMDDAQVKFVDLQDLSAARSAPPTLEPPVGAAPGRRTVWTASSSAQYSFEDSKQGGGVFTNAFLEGVRDLKADSNRNGRLTNSELLFFVRKKSAEWCQQSRLCREKQKALTPQLSGRVEDPAVFGMSAIVPPQSPTVLQITPSRPPAVVQAAVETVDTLPPSVPFTAPAPSPTPPAAQAPPTTAPPATSDALPTPVWPAPAADVAPQHPPQEPAQTGIGLLTDLFAADNAAGLTLEFSAGSRLELGDSVTIAVSSQRAGNLVVLDLNPDNELFQLFPSQLSAKGVTAIAAHQTMTLPEAFSRSGRRLEITVTEPAGRGYLLAILVEDEIEALQGLLPRDLAPGPIPGAPHYLQALANGLNTLKLSADRVTPVAWSAAFTPYEILR